MSADEYQISMAGGDGDPLDAIQRRADAASEGPWDAARGANANGTTYANSREDKAIFLAASLNDNKSPLWLVASDTVIPAATGDGPRAKANAEFIAHARTDVPALLALVRDQAAKLEAVRALHKPIKVYDECECPDGTHPEEYEWIDCEDYNGCENSFTHWACEECCTAFDYVTEACSDSHTHSKSKGQRCPTIAALEPTP